MLENSTNAVTRDAIERAHAERAKAARMIWAWLFRSSKQTHPVGLVDPA